MSTKNRKVASFRVMQFPERMQLSGFFLVLYWPFCFVLWGMFSYCVLHDCLFVFKMIFYVMSFGGYTLGNRKKRDALELSYYRPQTSADTISLAPSVNRACREISGKEQSLYYYMSNCCNLIGLEQWYFNLIWNTYMWKLQNPLRVVV